MRVGAISGGSYAAVSHRAEEHSARLQYVRRMLVQARAAGHDNLSFILDKDSAVDNKVLEIINRQFEDVTVDTGSKVKVTVGLK